MPRSAPSLQLEPGRSATLSVFVAATHGAALLACLLAGWSDSVKAGCVLAVIASAALSFNQYLRRPEVKTLRLVADGSWRLVLRDGRECECRLSADSIVLPSFTILIFLSSSGMWRVPVFRDSVDSETYRQLRVALRLYRLSDTKQARDDRES